MKPLIDLLETLENSESKFRPTEIYNEGWLLRILLNEYSQNQYKKSPLNFSPGADWYSEAMLPTRFKARYRGDKHAESRTNADGVIGHIKVGEKGKADLELDDNAKQLTVVEAKMNSSLSKGTTKAPNFDQAARNVACMAEVLNRSAQCSGGIDYMSFVVIAPKSAIDSGKFSDFMNEDSIKEKVHNRVYSYQTDAENNTDSDVYIEWYNKCFRQVIDSINLITLSWEKAIDNLDDSDKIDEFYEKCKEYN